MPHPEKADRGGEDGFFMSKDGLTLGVADGVGGWADAGVNPAFFTWTFMKRCLYYSNAADASGSTMPLADRLMAAWADTVKTGLQGSCTTAVVGFEKNDPSTMHVHLVGDCGVVVVRNGQVVLRTKERQYKFNFPHQIGSDGRSSPKDLAGVERFAAENNDIVILGTDGVFDNVFDNEIASIVDRALRDAKQKQLKSIVDCQALADKLAEVATVHGADQSFVSPFSVGALKAGYRYVGGKQDDVCVVVGVLGAAEEELRQPPYDAVENYFAWAKKPCADMPAPRPSGKL